MQVRGSMTPFAYSTINVDRRPKVVYKIEVEHNYIGCRYMKVSSHNGGHLIQSINVYASVWLANDQFVAQFM